jgi:hypothetical protein
MAYHKLLLVILISLMLSVLVQGENLFGDEFFIVSYAMMSFILIVGMKSEKSYENALGLGFLLLLLAGILSTWIVIDMVKNMPIKDFVFRFAVTVVMNSCSLGFFWEGRKLRKGLQQDYLGRSRKDDLFWRY